MKRVLLKLSGEALAGDKKTGFDEATCIKVAEQVKKLTEDGIQVAIVTGGGNFWRGRTSETIDRTKADQIGMLATVMNCIYVSDIFRYVGMKTEVFTPFVCGSFTSLFSKDAAVAALEEGKVIFFAGGTGHPYFSIHAMEQDAGIPLAELRVDGGAATNSFLLQFQSDITGVPVLRPSTLETTALGAAYLAGLAVGYWADLSEIRRNWQVSAAFSPAAESEKIKEKLAGWHHAVRQARLSDEAE